MPLGELFSFGNQFGPGWLLFEGGEEGEPADAFKFTYCMYDQQPVAVMRAETTALPGGLASAVAILGPFPDMIAPPSVVVITLTVALPP